MFSSADDLSMNDSALKIQSIARGRKARRGNRRLPNSSSSPSKNNNIPQTEEDRASAKLQARQRGVISRKRVQAMKEQKEAAQRIQSIHRGREGRRVVNAKKQGGIDLEYKDVRKGLGRVGMNPMTGGKCYVELNLREENIRSIDVLRDFKNLQEVDLTGNCIKEVKAFEELRWLTKVVLKGNRLTKVLDYDVPFCNEECKSANGHNDVGSILVEADLSYNLIEEIRDLKKHRFIHKLELQFNAIQLIQGMNSLKMLQYLDLSNSKIQKIEGLDHLNIVELKLDNNQITVIENLASLHKLEKLSLNGNQISSLKGLKFCTHLRELDVGRNGLQTIRQVEYLSKVERLSSLVLSGNPCVSLVAYRLRVIMRLQGLNTLDKTLVSPEEKVKSINFYGIDGSDLSNRQQVWDKYFQGQEFKDYLPAFVDDERSEEEEGEVVHIKPVQGVVENVISQALEHVLHVSEM